ncbi:MAG: hypothetical protein QGF56_03550 [Verrucomicrobiota bacterium]|nr:hypothetical protein [Verrucomicrobiota bacterium]
MAVELKLERKAAPGLHQGDFFQIGSREERLAVDIKNKRISPVNSHFPGIFGAIIVLLKIEHDKAVIFAGLLFAGGLASEAEPEGQDKSHQKMFEPARFTLHNLRPLSGGATYTVMGKQHNKVIKRKRRKAYLKRKKAAVDK